MPPQLTPAQQALVYEVRAKRARLEEVRAEERRLLNEIDALLRAGEDEIRAIKLDVFGGMVGMTGSNIGKIIGPQRSKQPD